MASGVQCPLCKGFALEQTSVFESINKVAFAAWTYSGEDAQVTTKKLAVNKHAAMSAFAGLR